MNPKHLILLSAVTIAASSLTSCSYDEYELPNEEVYTRNFIKTFGLIDPAQDWNLAQNTAVTVRVGDKPSHVKAYMKVDGTYYIVANLENVSGNVNIPFDMPEGTNDILVKINDKPYYTTPGGTVDPAAPASRGLQNEGTTTFADVTVTVEKNPHGRLLTLDDVTVKEILKLLPESSAGGVSFKDTNFGKVTDNFIGRAKEFYLFPEYWDTNGAYNDIIGIYWYVDPDTDGAEKITIKKPGWGATELEGEYWIMKAPFFQNPNDFFTAYDKDGNIVECGYKAFNEDPYHPEQTPVKFESTGIHVKFNKEIVFGFYIQQGDNIMYSESKLNEYTWFNDVEGNWYHPSYVATVKNGEDTEHNDKRHLCFEDWYKDNFDLNDMVFRVYGFDHIADPNSDMDTGKIADIDKGEDVNKPDDDNPPVVEEPYHWLLAVEDLGATDDFDFNDIVMGITAELTTEALPTGARTVGQAVTVNNADNTTAQSWNKVTFTALAAGGTKAAYIFYDGNKLYPDGKATRAEWHEWFGTGDYSSKTMINTMGSGVNNVAGASCTVYFGSAGGGSDANYLFTVEKLGMGTGENVNAVDGHNSGFKIGIDNADAGTSMEISTDYFTKDENGYFVKPANPGEAPQMFLIPDRWNKNAANTGTSTYDTSKWQWPVERQHIQGCYPRFKDWVADHTTNADWYKDTGKNVCRPTPTK